MVSNPRNTVIDRYEFESKDWTLIEFRSVQREELPSRAKVRADHAVYTVVCQSFIEFLV